MKLQDLYTRHVAKQTIKKHLGLMVNELQMQGCDIEKRIKLDLPPLFNLDDMGVTTAQSIGTGASMQTDMSTVQITLYPLLVMFGSTLNSKPIVGIELLSRRTQREILFGLAHEVKHYHQHWTQDYHKMYQADMAMNPTLYKKYTDVPYSIRTVEQDANRWAMYYVAKYL